MGNQNKSTYYITTPIYYPSDKLHIGHAYSTTVADTLARYRRLRGDDVRFLTGTDDHGLKMQRRAEAAGKPPLVFVDEIVEGIRALWKRLDISYDDFIRTTEDRHKVIVQQIFSRLLLQGDIYEAEYEGWYCTPCESYWTGRQLKDGKCPDCGREVELVRHPAYFLRTSRYADRLIDYYEKHPEFILPESRKNEMLNNFLLPGLEDLCVSRTNFTWGIPVRENPQHVIYVWLDALTNYITAPGYMADDHWLRERFAHYWPANVHVMAKEIVRFHAIYWPIILMALNLPLPEQIIAHGWLLTKEGKMSKSKGNVIDPNVLIDRYGSDALRYFLLREVPFGQDGVFTIEAMLERLNFDLANDLGNFLHRSLSMVGRFAGGVIPQAGELTDLERSFARVIDEAVREVEDAFETYQFSAALTAIWKIVRRGNRYVDETAPWALNKAGDTERLGAVLYFALDVARRVAILLQPFMPKTPLAMFVQMGVEDRVDTSWDAAKRYGLLPAGVSIRKAEPIFPRLELEKEVAELDRVLMRVAAGSGVTGNAGSVQSGRDRGDGGDDGSANAQTDAADIGATDDKSAVGVVPLIQIDNFNKMDLRVAQVSAAEKIAGADKLLKLRLDLGFEERQVVSGIAKFYKPEELVGLRVILVANLQPVKLRGVESQGMILAASAGEQLVLATVAGDIPLGAQVK